MNRVTLSSPKGFVFFWGFDVGEGKAGRTLPIDSPTVYVLRCTCCSIKDL